MGSAAGKLGSDLTVADLLEPMPNNWGKWGDDDELGAINYLGSEEMLAGMEAVTEEGDSVERFTLQTPITGNAISELVGAEPDEGSTTRDTGDPAFPGRLPARRDNVHTDPGVYDGMKFRDDRFVTPLYLQGTTHMDALGHGWYGDSEGGWHDDKLYNGHSAQSTNQPRTYENAVSGCGEGDVKQIHGLGKNDISNAADAGVSGRGVLLDVGRDKGDDENGWLELGEAITLQDLKDTAGAQGVEIQERDIILIRTGAVERARDPSAAWNPLFEPGLTYSDDLVEWVHEMEFPILGADNLPVEKVTHQVSEEDLSDRSNKEELAGTYILPLHGAFLRDLGVTLNEVLDLSELGAAAAEDGIYTFQYNAAPLHVEMATGGPVNPVVLKATEG